MLQINKNSKDCDMHMHTYYSDGIDSPEAVIEKAYQRGIMCCAITDHDNVKGVLEGEKKAAERKMEFHSGIELSSEMDGVEIHILGYDIDIDNKELKKECAIAAGRREERNKKMIAELERLYGVTKEEIFEKSKSGYIARPVMARALVEKGVAADLDEAFKNVFSRPEIASIEKAKTDAKRAIEVIKGAGGTAVLAHPGKIKNIGKRETEEFYQNIEKMLDKLIIYGLKGLEAVYKKHSQEENACFSKIAEEKGLIITRGSDYHGD